MPNTQAIKHEVEDETAKERTHPIFDPLLEQFEGFTQMIQRLRQRHVLVKLPEQEKILELKTPTVPNPRVSGQRLEQIKRILLRQVGKSRQEIEQEIAKRTQQPKTSATFSIHAQDQGWKDALWSRPERGGEGKEVVFRRNRP